jgi:hypothetical protein
MNRNELAVASSDTSMIRHRPAELSWRGELVAVCIPHACTTRETGW